MSHHLVFRHSETTSLGAGNWFLGIVFTLLEVDRQHVQLDHHIAAVQLIVTASNTGEVRTREGQRGTSYRISNLLSKFLSILGTGLSSAIVMVLRSTGQVCCLLSHSTIQSAQKACSHLTQSSLSDSLSTINTHSGARRGSSSTALQIGQINSSSTDPSNLLTS